MPPGRLSGILERLPSVKSPDLIVGMDTMDDAGVYRLSDDSALVQTVDFFAPVVADPRTFGRIAAANSMSDIWAMGGKAITAMNLLCFPGSKLGPEVVAEILTGSSEKLVEAGVVLVGGHTAQQDEVLFGLSVTGVIHPELAKMNSKARPGDALVLTKPLGVGILTTANKACPLEPRIMGPVISSMERLNMYASVVLNGYDVSSMTDITGFGLLGHSLAFARSAGVRLQFYLSQVPVFPGTVELTERFFPGGSAQNRKYVGENVYVHPDIGSIRSDILFDAQTSGGLLAAVRADQAEEIIEALREAGDENAAIVGSVQRRETGEPPLTLLP
ncbi:MAG TPA: selenide, water dikinase SelD [Candidatus Sabulitectum sp.]|nr:selenide, water dikinase SelD [Candidatus Sabulitectum sp.]HPF32938.1 selenide, water dikinase SelD [Candidatus Sabulitectum sp.]HPJ27755.1 selenide, water dikinase SelD [Candidatus Sabulitectum sp.]HPR21701.1 selenide, water dikinase SelD [Candidatus Sabulitectum sp.]